MSTSGLEGQEPPVAKRPAELARFREMITKQTDELSIAIKQRSDYESRLLGAEKENDALRKQVAELQEKVTQITSSRAQDVTAATAQQSSPLAAVSERWRLVAEEQSTRCELIETSWRWWCTTLVAESATVASLHSRETAQKEERQKIGALTFQLRVATPLRIRSAMAKVAAAQSKYVEAAAHVDELTTRMEHLLLDASDLREQKSALEQTIETLTGKLANADRASESHMKKLDELQNQCEECQQQLEAAGKEIESLHGENSELRRSLQAAQQTLNAREELDASTVGAKESELIEKLRAAASREAALLAECTTLRAHVESLTLDHKKLLLQLDEERGARERDVDDAHQHWDQRIAAVNTELRSLRLAATAADLDLAAERRRAEMVQQELDAVRQKLDEEGTAHQTEVSELQHSHKAAMDALTQACQRAVEALEKQACERKDEALKAITLAEELKLAASQKDGEIERISGSHEQMAQRSAANVQQLNRLLDEMEGQLSQERNANRQLLLDVSQLRADVGNAQHASEILRARVQALESERDAWEKNLDQVASAGRSLERSRLEKYLEERQALLDSEMTLLKQKSVLQADVSRLSHELQLAKEAETSCAQQVLSLQSSLQQHIAHVQELDKRLEDSSQRLRVLERAHTTLKSDYADSQQAATTLSDLLSGAQQAKAALTEELFRVRDASASLEKEMSVLREELRIKSISLSETSDELFRSAEAHQALTVQCRELQVTLAACKEASVDLHSENESLRAMLEETIVAVETEVRALQVEVNAVKNERDRALDLVRTKDMELARSKDVLAALEDSGANSEHSWRNRFHVNEQVCATLRQQVDRLDQETALLSHKMIDLQDEQRREVQALLEQHLVELESERGNAAKLERRVVELTSEGRSLDDDNQLLRHKLAELTTSLHQLELASTEMLQEKELALRQSRDDHVLLLQRVETLGEDMARVVVRNESLGAEVQRLETELTRATAATAAAQDAHEKAVQQIRADKTQAFLDVEAMSDALLRQERALREEVLQERDALRLANATIAQELNTHACEAAQLRVQLDAAIRAAQASEAKLAECIATAEAQRSALSAQCSQLSAEVELGKEEVRRLEGLVELERASSVAEETALREEIRRREEEHAKAMVTMAQEYVDELKRRDAVAQELQRTRAHETDDVTSELRAVNASLQTSQVRHQQTLQQLREVQAKSEEVSHMLSQKLVECDRNATALRLKEEDVAAAVAQASDAMDRAALAERERASIDAQCQELRRALILLQREKDVAVSNEDSALQSVAQLEAAVEERWRVKLQHMADTWRNVFLAHRDGVVGMLERLESAERDSIALLYDNLNVAGHLGELASQWSRMWRSKCKMEANVTARLQEATFALSDKQRSNLHSERLLTLQLDEASRRCNWALQLLSTERQNLLTTLSATAIRCGTLERDVRATAGKLQLLDEANKSMRAAAAVDARKHADLERELDIARRDCDTFSKISDEASARAAELALRCDQAAVECQSSRVCNREVLQFCQSWVVELEQDARRTLTSGVVEMMLAERRCFADVLRDGSSERVELNRAKDKAASVMRSEVDHLHATWSERIVTMEFRLQGQRLQMLVQTLMTAEFAQRAGIVEAALTHRLVDVVPSRVSDLMHCLHLQRRREVQPLQHALFVTQKESLLTKQRAASILEHELAACRSNAQRIHRRRLEDLRWLPDTALRIPIPPRTAGTAVVASTPGEAALGYVVEDLEDQSRSILVRMALDSLHALHMCLLIW